MNPADVLEAAADVLFVHGRTVGRYHDPEGRHCAVGAVNTAERLLGVLHSGALTPLSAYVGGSIIEWNDAIPLSPEGDELVIDTLRRAAKALRNGELEP